MRILSWNINGVRTLPQYHPWNTFQSFSGILEHLKADIICFQEMKTSRAALERNVAVPDGFDGFFSFPVNKTGYSGVAVYTDARTVTPLKAEEGLSGSLQLRPPLTPDERISRSYPSAHEIELLPDEQGNTPSDLAALDCEGRALMIDFGLFVLINVYCPNETSDSRLPFKMNFHLMLEQRVRQLMDENREVIVVGDINICASPLDHCDGHLSSHAAYFNEHPARGWFHRWLAPTGCMTDIVRRFWPDRKGMYTCWNTKISARDTNYGTRVDYILVTPGMIPWIKHGDIQPSLKGSDHCPIFIDLHNEIVTAAGVKLTLRDVMPFDNTRNISPRLAAKHWDEFSGKQTLLSTFFGKGGKGTPIINSSPTPPATSVVTESQSLALATPELSNPMPTSNTPPLPPSLSTSQRSSSSFRAPNVSSGSQKRKATPGSSSTAEKLSKKPKNGQRQLSAFFIQPTAASGSAENSTPSQSPTPSDHLDADYQLALRLSASEENMIPRSSQSSMSSSMSKSAWSHLMAPVQPPHCAVHDEPAKEYTVNKPGPNKGKNFFICSRPVGPGYDKGKGERLREEVNPQYRCNFFKWTTDVKRETLKQNPVSSIKTNKKR
ncbi:Endonuclease/exonuclease/phosphatase [Hygrophoropsis aurantiaca]|uniref:Endonuclease/exonuclease/phosphatase n=1 Tax=Hygrophoropsis aurantiaca TaxID=72124 RepID=A0ACB8AA96_9AGAM|nr:Endonuclease/exonuclease/phosphatase [Hygrophoropsis aurantiaca]